MGQLTDGLDTSLGVEDLAAGYRSRRAERFADREYLARISSLPRCRVCGSRMIDATAGSDLKRSSGGVCHLTNFMLCGSAWACPVCSAKIRFTRAGEVLQVLAAALAEGHGELFATQTIPHGLHQALKPLIDGVTKAFHASLKGRPGRQLKADFGVTGYVRALEVTHGYVNGWHPHLHTVFITEEPTTPSTASEFRHALYPLWCNAVTALGFGKPNATHGVDVQRVHDVDGLSSYLAKIENPEGVSRELVWSDRKKGRNGNRSYFQIVGDARRNGDLTDVPIIHEHEAATRRKRIVDMSRGLKARYSLVERTDEDIAAEEIGGETLLHIDTGLVRLLVKQRGAVAELLDRAETGGAVAAKQFLDTVLEAK